MPRSSSGPDSRARNTLIAGLKRLHQTLDRMRCDEIIQREGLDWRFDQMLDLCDEVLERIPEIQKVAA